MGVQFTTALMPSLASENVVTFEEKIVFGRKENHATWSAVLHLLQRAGLQHTALHHQRFLDKVTLRNVKIVALHSLGALLH